MIPVAALEDLALREGARGPVGRSDLNVCEGGVLRVDAEEGEVRVEEESGLARAADDWGGEGRGGGGEQGGGGVGTRSEHGEQGGGRDAE